MCPISGDRKRTLLVRNGLRVRVSGAPGPAQGRGDTLGWRWLPAGLRLLCASSTVTGTVVMSSDDTKSQGSSMRGAGQKWGEGRPSPNQGPRLLDRWRPAPCSTRFNRGSSVGSVALRPGALTRGGGRRTADLRACAARALPPPAAGSPVRCARRAGGTRGGRQRSDPVPRRKLGGVPGDPDTEARPCAELAAERGRWRRSQGPSRVSRKPPSRALSSSLWALRPVNRRH